MKKKPNNIQVGYRWDLDYWEAKKYWWFIPVYMYYCFGKKKGWSVFIPKKPKQRKISYKPNGCRPETI